MHKTSTIVSPTEKLNAFEHFTKKAVWPAYLGCLWALLYAVFVRFYQAAGGTLGISGQFENPEVIRMGSYLAGVAIMTCGFILIGLVKPWSKVVPKQAPIIGGQKIHPLVVLIPTLFCSAYLIAHALIGMITKTLLLAGIITLHLQGWASVDVHSLALWDLLFYEPWFIIMGILAGLTASHYALASGVSIKFFRRGVIVVIAIVLLITFYGLIKIIF